MTAGMARTAKRDNVKFVGIIVAIMVMIFPRLLATIKARQVFGRWHFTPKNFHIDGNGSSFHNLIPFSRPALVVVLLNPPACIVAVVLFSVKIGVFCSKAKAVGAPLFTYVKAMSSLFATDTVIPFVSPGLACFCLAVLALLFCDAGLALVAIVSVWLLPELVKWLRLTIVRAIRIRTHFHFSPRGLPFGYPVGRGSLTNLSRSVAVIIQRPPILTPRRPCLQYLRSRGLDRPDLTAAWGMVNIRMPLARALDLTSSSRASMISLSLASKIPISISCACTMRAPVLVGLVRTPIEHGLAVQNQPHPQIVGLGNRQANQLDEVGATIDTLKPGTGNLAAKQLDGEKVAHLGLAAGAGVRKRNQRKRLLCHQAPPGLKFGLSASAPRFVDYSIAQVLQFVNRTNIEQTIRFVASFPQTCGLEA